MDTKVDRRSLLLRILSGSMVTVPETYKTLTARALRI